MPAIKTAEHLGFCFGVTKAVETAYKELQKAAQDGVDLYCLGQLIHNAQETKLLEENGLKIASSIDDVPARSRVLIRAHGEPDSTYEKASEKEIEIIDATCPLVARIHEIARKTEKEGRTLIAIGNSDHPELVGILGCAKNAFAAGSEDEAKAISEKIKKAAESEGEKPLVSICSQTTLEEEKYKKCVSAICETIDDVKVFDTICDATKKRQEAAAKLAKESDLMVVIGDRVSSNSKKLFEICKKYCKNAVFAEDSNNIFLQDIQKYNKIGVAASASAPERIIKEVISKMSENFTNNPQNAEANEMSALMGEIENSLRLPGRNEVVDGVVVEVKPDQVVVNLGRKKDGVLPIDEVILEEGQTLADVFKVGDEIQAKVIKTADNDGNILLSKKKLQSGELWDEINAAYENKEVIEVNVVRAVNKGVIANYKEISGFIPMSLLADHYVETPDEYIGKTLPVKVSKVDQKRNKAVFSHKDFLTEERRKKIAEIWDTLNEGDVVEGKIMRFTDYGAFVDIGGIDGLLHISEISWGKLKHPQEVLEIGQTVNVKILNMNEEKGKISLGLKQNNPEPWSVIDEQYEIGQLVKGKVVQIKEYGAFIELNPGLDGLVHISEIAHKRVNKVSDELQIGQEVEAKILEIDKERRRISLSIKATVEPTEEELAAAREAEEAAKAAKAEAEEKEAEAPAEEVAEAVEEVVEEAAETVEEAVEEVTEAVEEAVEDAAEAVEEAEEKTEE